MQKNEERITIHLTMSPDQYATLSKHAKRVGKPIPKVLREYIGKLASKESRLDNREKLERKRS